MPYDTTVLIRASSTSTVSMFVLDIVCLGGLLEEEEL